MVRVIEGKIIWKRSEGTQKLLRVSGRFELSMVKLQLMYEGNPGGNRFWFDRISARFELSRESTVD